MAALLGGLSKTDCIGDVHVHSSSCGHATIAHGDHVDYVVGTQLHHVDVDGCSFHGEVRAVAAADVVMATTASRFIRRRGSGSVRLLANDPTSPQVPPRPTTTEAQTSKLNSYRFMTGLGLTACFMVVEFVVGLLINSLALQADAFHMASDVIAMLIGWYASHKAGAAKSLHATYGYRRHEVVGALINCVFLLSICFTITIEALQRIPHYAEIAEEIYAQVDLLMIVGGVGLGINTIGLFVFSVGHGHSHGGHGHSHGDHGHSHGGQGDSGPTREPTVVPACAAAATNQIHGDHEGHTHGDHEGHTHGDHEGHTHGDHEGHTHEDHEGHIHAGHAAHVHDATPVQAAAPRKRRFNLNIQGILLHMAGDAAGSVAVIISGLIVKYLASPLRGLADPLCSLAIVILLIAGTVSPLRRSIAIVIQGVPTHVDMHGLQAQLRAVPHVLSVSSFRIRLLAC
jgi:solute carrier family 30 (zinc transporter), member 1